MLLTLPTRGPTGQQIIRFDGAGCEHGVSLARVHQLFPEPDRPCLRSNVRRAITGSITIAIIYAGKLPLQLEAIQCEGAVPRDAVVGLVDAPGDPVRDASAVTHPEPYKPADNHTADDDDADPSDFQREHERGVSRAKPGHLFGTQGPHHQSPRQSRQSA